MTTNTNAIYKDNNIVDFIDHTIHGSMTNPITQNLTTNLTNTKLGTSVHVWCQGISLPTFIDYWENKTDNLYNTTDVFLIKLLLTPENVIVGEVIPSTENKLTDAEIVTSVNTELGGTDWQTGLSVGTAGQIPFSNALGSDLEYSDSLKWDGSTLELKGSGSTSATSSLLLKNSSNIELLRVRDDGRVGIGTLPTVAKVHISAVDETALYAITTGSSTGVYGRSVSGRGVFGFSTAGEGVYGLSSSGIGVSAQCSNGIGVKAVSVLGGYGLWSESRGTAGYFQAEFSSSRVLWGRINDGANNAIVVNGSGQTIIGDSTVIDPSAKLEVLSTTQGFLPPRMTNTEMNAIATPATGLMVYDTTNNLLNVYNGTTWTSL